RKITRRATNEEHSALASRLRHIKLLYEELATIVNHNIPGMVVNSLETLLRDPQLEATGFWQIVEHPSEGTLRLSGIPAPLSKTPRCGRGRGYAAAGPTRERGPSDHRRSAWLRLHDHLPVERARDHTSKNRDHRSGSVTVIQRFGGGLNLNVHYHTLLFDGVFYADRASGALDFRPLPPPTDEEVGVVLARIARRVQRLLKRRGLDPGDADMCQADPVVEESPVFAGISSASIQGRIALGRRAGARVWRVGADPDAPWVLSTAPRHAHLAGFDLHANVDAPASDRTRLEQLCRYLLRPAVAQDRLRRERDPVDPPAPPKIARARPAPESIPRGAP